MNDMRLEQLLRQSADTDPAPAVPEDLADRVRRLGRSRRRRHRVLAGSAVVLTLIITAGIWPLAGRTSQVADTPGASGGLPAAAYTRAPIISGPMAPVNGKATTSASAEVLALQAQIDQLRRQVARLEARIKEEEARRRLERRVAALRRELRKPDPRDLAMAEIEKTAFLGVHRAEACEKRNRTGEARKQYQQVVRLFPNTSWAKVAQARLNKESSEKGEK